MTEIDVDAIRTNGGAGMDLHNAYLRGADLHGADLREADLTMADLGGADLRGADLTGAKLVVARLYSADLSDANLTGADLSGARALGAIFTGARYTGATRWPPKSPPEGTGAIWFPDASTRLKAPVVTLALVNMDRGDIWIPDPAGSRSWVLGDGHEYESATVLRAETVPVWLLPVGRRRVDYPPPGWALHEVQEVFEIFQAREGDGDE